MEHQLIRRYLSLGFIPDATIATDYLRGLLSAPAYEVSRRGPLLIEIVGDLCGGVKEIAIPLTAGYDSRGLLGAALRLFTTRRIHCFTVGPDSFEDVVGARAACRCMGVEHHVIDPDRIEWSMPAIQRETERRLKAGMGTAPIDGIAVFSGLAAAIPDGLQVLSGFLGDAVSGKHLAGNASDNEPQLARARFCQHNAVLLEEQPQSLFEDFLTANDGLKARWPGLTTYDLLDLGFRQRLRIRSVTTACFERVIRPYEDARWIAHWFSKPAQSRVGQQSYVDALQLQFPRLFPPRSAQQRLRSWVGRQKRRSALKVFKPRSAGNWIAHRGHPRRNASMAAVLDDACRSFDRRGLAAPGAATTAFDQLMREPSIATFIAVRWYASAEVLARCGENS